MCDTGPRAKNTQMDLEHPRFTSAPSRSFFFFSRSAHFTADQLPRPAKTPSKRDGCVHLCLSSCQIKRSNSLRTSAGCPAAKSTRGSPVQIRPNPRAVESGLPLPCRLTFQPINSPDSASRKMKSQRQFDRDESVATAPPAAQPESDGTCSGLRLTRTHNAECSRKPSAAPSDTRRRFTERLQVFLLLQPQRNLHEGFRKENEKRESKKSNRLRGGRVVRVWGGVGGLRWVGGGQRSVIFFHSSMFMSTV